MKDRLKVAVIQLSAGGDRDKNIHRAKMLVERAARAGAEFVVLPEVFNCRRAFKRVHEIKEAGEAIPGPSTKPFMEIARKAKITILAGSVLEKSHQRKAYNTSVLISPAGKITAKYRKQNLFKAQVSGKSLHEAQFLLKGNKNVTARVQDFTIGLSICYDLRFVSMYEQYRQKGVDILCVPSSFTEKTGKAHWEVLLRARAIENQCFLLAPNQAGVDGRGVRTFGHSMIIDPWGSIINRAGDEKEKTLYATLSKDKIKKVKKILPLIRK